MVSWQVEFRSVMFWLFAREIITARLKESDANGLRSMVFFVSHIVYCLSFLSPVAKEVQFDKVVQHKEHAN
ncbi:hypothetical protein CK203_085542 [Vitis vinifera]|uniref:Uncharacterized protein n=1 Tax=Vitis vinifera TaxID=29760 RepID=A0A438C2J2_VITVI|nr:hypothetical protein CK203_085542 [Vitis vinifera]